MTRSSTVGGQRGPGTGGRGALAAPIARHVRQHVRKGARLQRRLARAILCANGTVSMPTEPGSELSFLQGMLQSGGSNAPGTSPHARVQVGKR